MTFTITLPQYDNDWYEHEFTPQSQHRIRRISDYFIHNHYNDVAVNRNKFCWYYIYDIRKLSWSYYFYDQMESDFEWNYTWVHVGQWLSSHVHFKMSDDNKSVEQASLSNSWGPFKSIELNQILDYAEYVKILWRDRAEADKNIGQYSWISKNKEFWIRADWTPGPSRWFYFSVQCPIKYVVIWQNETPSV